MNVLALIGLTVAAAQIVKVTIEKITGKPIGMALGTAIAVVVSIVEVAIAAIKTGAVVDVALLFILVQVIIGAVGGFKVLMQAADKAGLADAVKVTVAK